MKNATGCHNCIYNGKGNSACLSCHLMDEEYSYPFRKYVLPTYDAPQPEPEEPMKATDLDDDTEDAMRKRLYQIFDLDFTELLLLKCIMNRMSLTEFANQFNDFIKYNTNKKTGQMTRFCAWQTRARMLKKLDKIALLTKGQKKELRDPHASRGDISDINKTTKDRDMGDAYGHERK